MKFHIAVLMLILLVPIAFASHSTRDRPDSVLNVPSVQNNGRIITATESYPYTGPRAVLPSSMLQQFCDPGSEVTPSPAYTGRFSEDYYTDDIYTPPRSINLQKPTNGSNQTNATGSYWEKMPSAYERICTRRDYSAYYNPTDGIADFKYYQRIIGKDTDYRPEVTIDAPPPQRLLADDARVKSIALPDYVDVSEVPYYVPPANPKERPWAYAAAEPNRRLDDQGAYRFIPGNWQDRAYYYADEHTYTQPGEIAQRILRQPELTAQRLLSKSDYSRGQRLLSDEYGEEYGYVLTAPQFIEIYTPEEDNIGSVRDARLFQYIRDSGKMPSYYLHPDVDERYAQEDISEINTQYKTDYYATLGVSPEPADDGVISDKGAAFTRIPHSTVTTEYYRQKLAFINNYYAFVHRGASQTPVPYRTLPLNAAQYGEQSPNALRIMKYENPAEISAQRILSGEPVRAQRRLS